MSQDQHDTAPLLLRLQDELARTRLPESGMRDLAHALETALANTQPLAAEPRAEVSTILARQPRFPSRRPDGTVKPSVSRLHDLAEAYLALGHNPTTEAIQETYLALQSLPAGPLYCLPAPRAKQSLPLMTAKEGVRPTYLVEGSRIGWKKEGR